MLLVSMATMLGTSELMTEDLNRKQESENSEGKNLQMTSFQEVCFLVFGCRGAV